LLALPVLLAGCTPAGSSKLFSANAFIVCFMTTLLLVRPVHSGSWLPKVFEPIRFLLW